nr:MAG TPA: hypothetical protein [Caudoviricetes sp.]
MCKRVWKCIFRVEITHLITPCQYKYGYIFYRISLFFSTIIFLL